MITIEELVRLAKEEGASDLHLTVGVPPILRINGELRAAKYERLTPLDTERIVFSIMEDFHRKQFEINGQVDFSFSYAAIGRFRVNVFKQRGSIAAALRLVNIDIPDPKQIGLADSVVEVCNYKRGLVLVTGPTGSGKSTTLASLINKINETKSSHIITLEDPIEYLHTHKRSIINQREIKQDTMSFADALKAALRQDPDVILVGEMRDLETIAIAITAAETGHLVFSTLHTIGAASTVDRIIDSFPPHQQQQIRVQLASVLKAVVSQQLIPKLDGKERIADFEKLHVNPALRNLIKEGKTNQIETVMQTNKKSGMQTLSDSLMDLYKTGRISKEQAITFAQDSGDLSKKIM